MGDGDNVAEITLREVFDAVMDVKNTLAGMASHGDAIKDHETRIRALEKWVWGAAGTGVVGGAALSQLITALMH